jgi:hypothetical protein
MQTDSNHPNPANAAPPNSKSHSGKLLIPRSQRRRFVVQFTCMTILGWVVGGVASIAVEKILLGSVFSDGSVQLQIWSYWIRFLSNIIFAVIFAADQALVMRRYLSGGRWLVATSIGWLTANGVATAWINYIATIANSLEQNLSPELAVIFGFLSTISYILSGIWLGLFQWLVLRHYTSKSWWWNFVPSLAFLIISLLIWFLSLIQNLIPEAIRNAILYSSQQGFTAVILGVIPAIALCTFKRNIPAKLS